MASVNAFIPAGRWYDIFTGRIYDSTGTERKLYRPLSSIPVLLPAGGIVPESLGDRKNGTENPDEMRLLIGAGADGRYTLYEDDGVSLGYREGKSCSTDMAVTWNKDEGSCTVTIEAAAGDLSLIPEKRRYEIVLYGIEKSDETLVSCSDGCRVTAPPYEMSGAAQNSMTILLDPVPVDRRICVRISGLKRAANDHKKQVFEILERARIETLIKENIYREICEADSDAVFLRRLSAMNIPESLKDAVREVVLFNN
jgi:hypothetical protein